MDGAEADGGEGCVAGVGESLGVGVVGNGAAWGGEGVDIDLRGVVLIGIDQASEELGFGDDVWVGFTAAWGERLRGDQPRSIVGAVDGDGDGVSCDSTAVVGDGNDVGGNDGLASGQEIKVVGWEAVGPGDGTAGAKV